MNEFDASVNESKYQCRGCGYSLTGATIGGRCPECGISIEESLAAAGAGSVPASSLDKISYVGPIVVTILCCVMQH